MLRRIEPSVIICYHTPFPEMQGNIVHVDYELSSWKHDEDDLAKAAAESSESIRIVKHTGYVIFDDFFTSKGGGSATEGGGAREYPGSDPNKAPPGFDEWRGQAPAGGDKGAWYNPETGESLHPDLNHGPPAGEHWDYNDGMGGHFQLFPDGSISPKSFEGEMIYA